MPPSAKSLAATLREKHRRGSVEPKEGAADPSYFGADFPSLDNETLDVVYTAPLMGIFALDTSDLCDLSPQAQDMFTSEFPMNLGLCGQIFTSQLQPDSEKSPQNAQAFRAADNVVMGDGFDLNPNLEVCKMTYQLFM